MPAAHFILLTMIQPIPPDCVQGGADRGDNVASQATIAIGGSGEAALRSRTHLCLSEITNSKHSPTTLEMVLVFAWSSPVKSWLRES